MRKGTKNYGNYLHFLSVKEGQTGGRKKSIQTLRSDLAQEVCLLMSRYIAVFLKLV